LESGKHGIGYIRRRGMGKQALKSREMLPDRERREARKVSKRELEKQRDKERKEKYKLQGRE